MANSQNSLKASSNGGFFRNILSYFLVQHTIGAKSF